MAGAPIASFLFARQIVRFRRSASGLRERKDGIRIRGLEKSGLRTQSRSLARCFVFANREGRKQVRSSLSLSQPVFQISGKTPSLLSSVWHFPAAEIRELLLPRSRSSFTRTGDGATKRRTDGWARKAQKERKKGGREDVARE